MLPSKIYVNWPFGSGGEAKKKKEDFHGGSHGDHFSFTIGTILVVFFYLQVTPILPAKFQVNWPFESGGEAKNRRFLRWRPWRPPLFSDQNDFSYFLIDKPPRCFHLSFMSIGLLVQDEKQKNRFSRFLI